jgi:hypothetical protein
MAEFIGWTTIEAELDRFNEQSTWLEQQSGKSRPEFIDVVANKLLQVTDTREWITYLFALLGHSQNKYDYAALEGLWKFQDVQQQIDDGDRKAAQDIAHVLTEIGLQHIVDQTNDLESHFRGYKVGMESHKRKNRQGTSFEDAVEEELEKIVAILQNQRIHAELRSEYRTEYQDESGQTKTVDFAILEQDEPRLVFEANSYTGGGSKPSEVKRAYDRVSSRMRQDGIECVWITDGEGWNSSLRHLLGEAYVDIIDLYNLDMVQQELGDDVLNFFLNGPVAAEDEISIPRE